MSKAVVASSINIVRNEDALSLNINPNSVGISKESSGNVSKSINASEDRATTPNAEFNKTPNRF